MTLVELKTRCDEAGITYRYGIAEDGVEPPFLIGILQDSNNFIADNKIYKKIDKIELHYIFKTKSLDMEKTIEDTILADVVWTKNGEGYYLDNEVWEIVYNFELIDNY